MQLNLKNKVVLITGGAGLEGSIGISMVRALAGEGAIPAILDKHPRGEQYAADLKRNGKEAFFVQADVTDPEQVKKAVADVVANYSRIDVVINNVGVNDGAGLSASCDEFMDSIKLNLLSYFLTIKYALPELRKSKGNILNIGSKVALTGQGNTSGYAAAKGGVLALTREWAVDLVHDKIRCNCLVISECYTPGYEAWIDTLENGDERLKHIKSRIPLENRMTTPQEIANTALFLISDQSSHTTGQFVFVDGGYVHLDRVLH